MYKGQGGGMTEEVGTACMCVLSALRLSLWLEDFVLVNGNMQVGQCQKQFDLLISK